MTTPIEGAAVGCGANRERGAVELRIDLPGWDAPLTILLPEAPARDLARLLTGAIADLADD